MSKHGVFVQEEAQIIKAITVKIDIIFFIMKL